MADTVHVAAAIIYRNGKILAAHRADGSLPGGWELPGGKLDPGEAPREALAREVREELGCDLQLVWLYDVVEHDYDDFHLTMDCFVCTLAPGHEPRMSEGVHDDLRWLGRDELLDVAWLPADEALVYGLGLCWDVAFEPQHL